MFVNFNFPSTYRRFARFTVRPSTVADSHGGVWFTLLVLLATVILLVLGTRVVGNPPTEPFGVTAELVDVPPHIPIPGPEDLPNRVLRVEAVGAGMPAARLGLKRGDLIVAIDSMRFTTTAGFRHALWCSSDRPSFLVWRAASRKLTIQNVPYAHRQPDPDEVAPQLPDSYWMSIDIR